MFYCEAFVGVKLSVALFHHFFSLRMHDPNHCSGCVSFSVVHSGNTLMRSGKKVENHRRKWVFMDVQGLHERLELPTALPEKLDRWGHEKLTNPRAVPVLEKMTADMGSKLTGAMLVKEFLTQRLAPLQAHSHPLWDLRDVDDDIRLRPGRLTGEELSRAVLTLLEKIPDDLPATHVLLYRRDDEAALVEAMPTFNELGLMPPAVMVSSGDESEEGEEEDSEATMDDAAQAPTPPRSKLRRDLSEDDDAAEPPVKEALHSTGAATKPGATPLWRSGRVTPGKGSAAPPPRDVASAKPAIVAAPRLVASRLANPQDAGTSTPRKAGIALALKKRAYVALDV